MPKQDLGTTHMTGSSREQDQQYKQARCNHSALKEIRFQPGQGSRRDNKRDLFEEYCSQPCQKRLEAVSRLLKLTSLSNEQSETIAEYCKTSIEKSKYSHG